MTRRTSTRAALHGGDADRVDSEGDDDELEGLDAPDEDDEAMAADGTAHRQDGMGELLAELDVARQADDAEAGDGHGSEPAEPPDDDRTMALSVVRDDSQPNGHALSPPQPWERPYRRHLAKGLAGQCGPIAPGSGRSRRGVSEEVAVGRAIAMGLAEGDRHLDTELLSQATAGFHLTLGKLLGACGRAAESSYLGADSGRSADGFARAAAVTQRCLIRGLEMVERSRTRPRSSRSIGRFVTVKMVDEPEQGAPEKSCAASGDANGDDGKS